MSSFWVILLRKRICEPANPPVSCVSFFVFHNQEGSNLDPTLEPLNYDLLPTCTIFEEPEVHDIQIPSSNKKGKAKSQFYYTLNPIEVGKGETHVFLFTPDIHTDFVLITNVPETDICVDMCFKFLVSMSLWFTLDSFGVLNLGKRDAKCGCSDSIST